uniref:Uncharacterized protein n=1 Tax=Ananas comosus var. bracteatus TaxID=296719 RepID=A0A6V7QDT6_ANACO|nr:unnamed protein product [Ananas comosus var. bracteatus]
MVKLSYANPLTKRSSPPLSYAVFYCPYFRVRFFNLPPTPQQSEKRFSTLPYNTTATTTSTKSASTVHTQKRFLVDGAVADYFVGGDARRRNPLVEARRRGALAPLPRPLRPLPPPPLPPPRRLRPHPHPLLLLLLLPPYPPQSLLCSSRYSSSSSSAAAAAAAAVVALLLLAAAAAAVAHSVHRGFFGRPVKLLPALRSLPGPLARLLLTLLAALLPVALTLTLIGSLLLLSLRLVPHTHLALLLIYSLFASACALILSYLLVNWSLAGVIAIMESSFGFTPLRRSGDLIAGMRWAALCLLLFFSAGIGLMLWGFNLGRTLGEYGDWTKLLPIIARTVFGSGIITVLLLYWLVTAVVLYMHCKALHGELAGEIVEEFASEYIFLPFDDRKVPHVVSVVHP